MTTGAGFVGGIGPYSDKYGGGTPITLTAGQIAAPTAAILANHNATYQLNVAPYTRYQSNGTALIPISATGNAVLSATQTFTGANTFGDGTGSPQITIDGAAATNKGFNFRNAGVNRWRLLTDASNDLNVYAYDSGGAFIDTAMAVKQAVHQVTFNYQILTNNNYAPSAGAVTGTTLGAHNTGTHAAYGHLAQYFSVAGESGFDTGFGITCVFDPAFIGGQNPAGQAVWLVAISPNDNSHFFGCNIGELNTVNRGPDAGWARDRASGNNPTGGLLFVPESTAFGQPGEGKNVTFGYSVSRSAGTNSTGFPVKSYNGYLVEPNAIVGLTGRGIYATGDITSTASQRPYAPAQFDGTWLHGLDHTLATYIDNHAETFLVGQGLAWVVGTTAVPTATATIAGSGSGSDASITLTPAGAGLINLATRVTLPTQTPASATAAGTAGQVAWDASFIYVCTATNTWKRVAIATW